MIIVEPNDMYKRMLASAHKNPKFGAYRESVVVALDPGETTGIAYWLPWNQNAIYMDQIETKDVVQGFKNIKGVWPTTKWPVHVVCEDYRIYGWKSDDHKWGSLHTPQLIGAIKILADQLGCSIHFQMAQQAKQFATDDLLKKLGIYHAGMKHARDAERHLLTTLFFGKTKEAPPPDQDPNMNIKVPEV
jgi:hypothetical protein